MKLVNQYIVPFTGLKEGEHEFRFEFKESFFKKYEILEVCGGNIEALVLLTKKANMLRLNIQMKGAMSIPCDRCLDTFQFPVVYAGSLVVKFGENSEDSTDEIWVIDPNEYKLDLEQYFYECISLSLPIQRIHPEDVNGISGCNPEMLKIIDTHKTLSKQGGENDPRWDKLKQLMNDN